MVGGIPEGWARAPLGDCLQPRGLFDGPFGSSLKSEDYTSSGVRVIRLENLANLRFVSEKVTFISDAKYQTLRKHTVRQGDVLFGSFVDGATRVCLVPVLAGPAIAKADCFCVRPDPRILAAKFLVYQLGAAATRDALVEQIHGVTRPRVTTKQLRQFTLLLPPLAEQLRIVDRVEALLAEVQAARNRLERVRQIVGRFRQAVFAAAFHGRLTTAWREEFPSGESAHGLLCELLRAHETFALKRRSNAAEPTDEAHNLEAADLPATWSIGEMEWVCEPGRPITYGILKPGPDVPGGVPYVRVADYPGNRLDLAGIKRTSLEIAASYSRATLRQGDLLLSIRGTFGRVCQVPRELEGANITQDTARLSIAPAVSAEYVLLYLQSPAVQKRLEQSAKGAAVRGVNIGDVRALQVALPPRREQDEIVRRVRALLQVAESIEKKVLTTSRLVKFAPQAILAKAFSGELVPLEAELALSEGREYESGSALLERVRSGLPRTEANGQVESGIS